MPAYVDLKPGDPAPWFRQRSFSNPRYVFDTAGGRYVVMCFVATSGDPVGRAAIAAAKAQRDFFDDVTGSFFAVTNDAADDSGRRVADEYPGYRWLFDSDGSVARLYGALPADQPADAGSRGAARLPVRRLWVVLDPALRVLKVTPFRPDRSDIAEVMDFLGRLPPVTAPAGFEVQAPILVLPNVFEPEFCRQLIDLYEASGGEESGFMREIDGKTVAVHDHAHKRRRDHVITDKATIDAAQARFLRRVVPMIQRAFQFKVSRMERYIVCCYAAEDEAHFRAHRDNTTRGTAHRRFAVSVNLNEDFDGGEVSFPEYGPRSFKPPPGGAVVFSCSLLHAVSKVRRGRRFAFLPFLYDDEAARVREANAAYLEDGRGAYKAE